MTTPGVVLTLGLLVSGDLAGGTATEVQLPHPHKKGRFSVEEAISQRRSVRLFRDRGVALADIGQILWAGQGMTDSSRGFRAAPSAGGLFPLGLYLYAGNVSGLSAGVYRYDIQSHTLAPVRKGDVRSDVVRSALGQDFLGQAPAGILITADYHVTTGKYGSRGRRYVEIEVGHAAQNIWLQAIALGMGAGVAGAFDDSGIATIFHLPKGVDPLYLIAIGYPQ